MNKTIIISVVVILIVLFSGYFLLKNKSYNLANDMVDPLTNQVVDGSQMTDLSNDKNTTDKDTKLTDNNKKVMQAIMHTTKGDIEIEFGTTTPKTVENFIKLAKEGFYDGVKFHRVIKGFMIQGGDPLTKDDSQMAYWGTGGPGYKFNDELNSSNKNDIGTISMANSGPNTNGSQFFINTAANNFLDPKHVVFGKVIEGMDVVTEIENTKTGPSDRPIEPIVIKSITLK